MWIKISLYEAQRSQVRTVIKSMDKITFVFM